MIFFFCGIIRIIQSTRVDITANWSSTVGTIYVIVYLVISFADLTVFYTRNVKFFNYTIFTLLLRIAAGTVALLYLSILVNGFFTYYPLGLVITLAIGILKGITKNSFSLIFHVMNITVQIIGSIALYFVFKADPFYLLTAVMTVIIYQVAIYHESSLTNFL